MCPLKVSAQNDLNIYQNFTGDSSAFYTSQLDEYDGEYQWFYKPETGLHWFDLSPFDELFFSWKIDLVSFPFVPDMPRTLASDSLTRILGIAEGYDPTSASWASYDVVRIFDSVLSGQSMNVGFNPPFAINQESTLASNYFTVSGGAASERIFLPHSVLRHTLYIHQSNLSSAKKIDSVSFILDHTRGRMRYYPFVPANADSLTSTATSHDVTIQHKFNLSDSLNAMSNNINSPDYFPPDVDFVLLDNGSSVFCNIPNVTCPTGASNDATLFARPSSFSYNQIRTLDAVGYLPVGYKVVSSGTTIIPFDGLKQHYMVDQNIDLKLINPVERIIYNPSQVIVEADSLVLPSGYTFKTVRGLYPTEAEVDTSSWCTPEGVPAQYVVVPTDLEPSQYILTTGSRVFAQPCLYLYDMIIRVDSGAVFSFYPEGTYGNYMLVNNGGTIDSLAFSGLCNNCRCVQEYTVANNYNVTSNTTVNSDATVNGLIRVKPGKVLTIRNCTVRFSDSDRIGRRSGILVEPGGRLLLDNAVLTSLICDRLWDGVEVQGDPEIVSPFATTANQGGVRMINDAIISRARVGIYAGGFCPEGLFCPEDYNYGGGYVEIDSARFLNNRIGMKFASYSGPHLGYIRDATFSTTIRENYLYENDIQLEHVLVDNRSGVRIEQSTFSNELYEQFPDYRRGTGITSLNSSVTADSCTFFGLTKAVDAYTYSGLNRRLHFMNNTVEETYFPLTIRGGLLDRIISNKVKVPTLQYIADGAAPVIDTNYGVYLLGSQMFRVAANSFQSDSLSADNYPYALAIRNSSLGGGASFFNRMEGYAIGIQTEGDNRHVLLRCDTLESQRNTDYRLNPVHEESLLLDSLADFGSACLQGGTANNIFLGSNFNVSKQIVNPVYYASGQPEETYSESSKHNLLSDFVECGMDEADLLSCPSLFDCWLVDCENMATVNLDTIMETTDTLIFSPLRMHAYQEILTYALDELDSLEFVIAFLEAEGSLLAKRILLPYYLEAGNYTAAAQLLTDLDNYQGHPYDEAENQQHYKLYGAVYNTYTAGKKLHEMTATQRNKVEEVAQTPYGVAFAAQAIQAHNMGERFHRIPDSSPSPQPRFLTQSDLKPRVKIYPNPTMSQIAISASCEIKTLVLYDLFGRIVESWRPNANLSTLNLLYPTGMYLLTVELDGGYIAKHRLIIAK